MFYERGVGLERGPTIDIEGFSLFLLISNVLQKGCGAGEWGGGPLMILKVSLCFCIFQMF